MGIDYYLLDLLAQQHKVAFELGEGLVPATCRACETPALLQEVT